MTRDINMSGGMLGGGDTLAAIHRFGVADGCERVTPDINMSGGMLGGGDTLVEG